MKIKKYVTGTGWVQEYPEVNIDSIVATGTPSSTTFLRGDGTWATPADSTTLTSLGITATATELNFVDGVTSAIQTQLNGKEPAFTKNTAFNKNFGTTAGTVSEGNHTHTKSQITDFAHTHPISEVTNLQTSLDAKAPLASPALTGTPTAPTADTSTNNTQIATTAFVKGVLSGIAGGLNFKGQVSLATTKTADDLYGTTAGKVSAPGDYLIVSAAGSIATGSIITLTVESPGDEGDSTPPVTLEVGDWIMYQSFSAQTLNVVILNNNDASKASAVHTHTIANVTGLQTAIDGKVSKAGDTMTGDLTIDKTAPKLFMADDVLTLGLSSEVDGQLINFGTNYNQLGSRDAAYPGSFFRIDVRDSAASEMFNIKYIPPNGTEQTVFKVSRTGDVNATGALTLPATGTLHNLRYNFTSGQADSRSWFVGNDAFQYGAFNISTETAQGNNTLLSRFHIDGSGKVGIGTSSPTGKLTVFGETHYYDAAGVKYMNSDPRWEGDTGRLHIWATTAAGGTYGSAGLALYDGDSYNNIDSIGNEIRVNGSAVITAGNIGSQSVNYATSSGSANAVAWGNVSSKPSNIMYYQSFTLDANTMDSNATGFTYSVNAPATGPITRFSAGGGYDLWLNAPYGGGNELYFRTRNGDTATLNGWKRVWHDGNFNPESYTPNRSRTIWNDNTVINNVVGQLAWKNYGNNHTIFDASASTSPDGGAVNNTNSQIPWSATYPTLMGWNGGNTFGVRVDSARVADSAGNANSLQGYVWNGAGKDVRGTDIYADSWLRNYNPNTGLYNQNTGMHWRSTANNTFNLYSGSASTAVISFSTSGDVIRGHVYADNSNNIGFLNNAGGWALRTDSSNNAHITNGLYISGSIAEVQGEPIWHGGNLGFNLVGTTLTITTG